MEDGQDRLLRHLDLSATAGAAGFRFPASPGAIDAPPAMAAPGPREEAEGHWLVAGWQRVRQARTASEADAALRRMEAEALARGVQSLPAPALALIRTGDCACLTARWARARAQRGCSIRRRAQPPTPSRHARSHLDARSRPDFRYLAGLVSRIRLGRPAWHRVLAFGGDADPVGGGSSTIRASASRRASPGLAVAAAVALAGIAHRGPG
jgi:hypothetical protein